MTGIPREAKPSWAAVPVAVKHKVQRLLGTPVKRATRVYGGYGPSATFKLRLGNGSRAFLKATYPLPEGSAVAWALNAEERVYRRVGHLISPWAPTYIGSVRAEGWHIVLMEHVDGASMPPWTTRKAKLAVRSYAEFHASTLGRSLPRWLPRREHQEFAQLWNEIGNNADRMSMLAALARGAEEEAAAWLRRHIATLVQAGRALARAPGSGALLHLDTRSDNIRLQGHLLRIFDWPFACVGPPEFDLVAFAQSIESEGGPVGEQTIAWYSDVMPVRADVAVGAAAGVAGYFADRAPQPEVAELPRLRTVQRRQLKASLNLAARLLNLSEPAWLAAVPR